MDATTTPEVGRYQGLETTPDGMQGYRIIEGTKTARQTIRFEPAAPHVYAAYVSRTP
jgi:hypothetical protein